MRIRLGTFLLIAAFTPIFIWLGRAALRGRPHTIATPQEFEAVFAEGQVILHVDFGSLRAAQARPVIEAFQGHVATDYRFEQVVFRRLDCTDQSTPECQAALKWFRARQRIPIHSNGSIVFLRNGQIVEVIDVADAVDEQELLRRAEAAFVE